MSSGGSNFRTTLFGGMSKTEAQASVQGFDDLVGMMKASASSPEAIALAEGMGKLASLVEEMSPMLASPVTAKTIGPKLVELMGILRQHHKVVVNLDTSWRELPEHAGYTVALNNFRLLLNQWLMERSVNKDDAVQLDDLEPLAWRTLGDGMLLMDMHRQLAERSFSDTMESELEPQRTARASNWWRKLRGE